MNAKIMLLILGALLPIAGMGMLIFNMTFGVVLMGMSALSFFAVFLIIIIERIQEKEEDKKHDYSDY